MRLHLYPRFESLPVVALKFLLDLNEVDLAA